MCDVHTIQIEFGLYEFTLWSIFVIMLFPMIVVIDHNNYFCYYYSFAMIVILIIIIILITIIDTFSLRILFILIHTSFFLNMKKVKPEYVLTEGDPPREWTLPLSLPLILQFLLLIPIRLKTILCTYVKKNNFFYKYEKIKK